LKAVRIHKHGGIDVLQLDEVDQPVCTHDKIKVKIKATALNHLDLWVRKGLPGINIPLPLIMGSDAAGEIVEIGEDINNFKVGDNIVIQPGTFDLSCEMVLKGKENYSTTYGILGETENGVQSEYIVLSEQNVSKMSKHLSFEQAASMQLVFMTSYQMLVTRGQLAENEFILIYGATSGIGSSSIQIAKDIGAKIITTVGDDDKMDYAYQLGADYVLNHSNNLVDAINKITKQSGVDIVCEHIGEKTWNQSMKVLKKGGRIVTCGSTSGPLVSIDLRHLFMKQQTIMGSTMASLDTFNKVMEKIKLQKYKSFVDKIYTFSEIKSAHERLEFRKNFGKIVLIPQ
jgi:NADPH:quinone reductase-like Zn-dependent oxidoreductase